MKIRTIGQAATSVRNFPSRIYSGEQLEACRQLGPEIRRVQPILPPQSRSTFTLDPGCSHSSCWLTHVLNARPQHTQSGGRDGSVA